MTERILGVGLKQLDGMVSARCMVRIERALQLEMKASFLATTVTTA